MDFVSDALFDSRRLQALTVVNAFTCEALAIEDRVSALVDRRVLLRVLEDWREPFDGYYLYYPSHRQRSAAFGLLLDALHYKG